MGEKESDRKEFLLLLQVLQELNNQVCYGEILVFPCMLVSENYKFSRSFGLYD